MNKYNKIGSAALLLFLLLFAGAALASTNSGIVSDAVSNKTDLSIAYLSSVFGTVSGVLTGTSGQMIGKLLYRFNQGMLVVAGCWLAFSVLMICFRSGLSGSFMQQQEGKSAPMICIRVALGFGFLIPNPSTGYTLLQGIVMQVTVQGIKLADQVWEYGLDYLNAGGSLWNRPIQQGGSSSSSISNAIISNDDINAILGTTDNQQVAVPDNFSTNLSFVQKIMAMEACMVSSSIELSRNNSSNSDDNSTVSSLSSSMPLNVYENLDNFSFEFPGGYSTNTRNTNCGVVYWNQNTATGAMSDCVSGDSNSSNSKCEFSHLALKEVIIDLLPAVHKYVCAKSDNPEQSPECGSADNDSDPDAGSSTYIADAMMSATLNFKNLIDPLVRSVQVQFKDPNDNVLNFYARARQDGWMVAGRYYWDMLQMEDAYDKALTNSVAYRNYSPSNYSSWNNSAVPVSMSLANQLMKYTLGSQGIPLAKSYMTDLSNSSQAGTAVKPSTSASNVGSIVGYFASAGMGLSGMPGVGALISIIYDFISIILSFSQYISTANGGLGAEPISWMHQLGVKLISLGFNMWLGFALAMVPAGALLFTCNAVSPLGGTAKMFLDWLQPILLGMAVAFIAIGFSIGFYIPLYPYMLFTFGVIGWIIAIMEAMVAAPLIALGITHPEGHDFLGRAAQAIMLLVGLFLRPVLMLIGLFAGMILCQVSLSIVLYTFSGFCADLFYISTPIKGIPSGDLVLQAAGAVTASTMGGAGGFGIGKLISSFLVFPLFLAIFAVMVYTTTVTCFSLIHQLPDYIMSWIGGPQHHGASSQNMLDTVKQGVTSGMHKGADVVGHASKGRKYDKNTGEVIIPGIQPPQQN